MPPTSPNGNDSSASQSNGSLSWNDPSSSTSAPSTSQEVSTPVSSSTDTPSTSGMHVSMIVAGILGGILIAWGWSSVDMSRSSKAGMATSTTSSASLGIATSSTPLLAAGTGFVIATPQTAGTKVTVTDVSVSVPTWIVVYENAGNKPGNALGATLFFPETRVGTINLLRAMRSGKSYMAVRQIDNGDRRFSVRGDTLVMVDGEVQWMYFETR